MIRPLIHVLALASALLVTSCKTTPAPDGGSPSTVANLVGISVDCTKMVAVPLAQAEIAKVATALSALDFVQAESDIRTAVSDLVSHGVALEAAWQDISCIVANVVTQSERHAYTTGSDDIAEKQIVNGKHWIDVHQVVYAQPMSGRVPAAPPGWTIWI